MAKFRKRPVVIEAVQFNGNNAFSIWQFMGRRDLLDNLELKTTDCPVIQTLEGDMKVSPGDWVVQGTAGEFYPVKPDIFEKCYEAV